MIIKGWLVMLKKHHILLLFCVFFTLVLNAQEVGKHKFSADVGAKGLVGYNNTYKWYEGVDLQGVMHLDNTDFSLKFEALRKDVYSMGLTVSPAFELCRNGFLFFDGTMHSRIFGKYKIYEFVYAGSVGFRMRHFSAQAGMFSRTMGDWGTEAFNFLYKLKISVMGFDNQWDVYLIGANFNDFEYERMWEPMCTLGGRWDFKERWSVVAEGTLKPSGMFSGNVKFNEAVLRVGIRYALSVRDIK